MELEVRSFGPPGRRAVGLLRRADREEPRAPLCLLCKPLGQEAIRTSATYRSLGDRLARAGCPSLSFDYHGTGDAPGDESDQSLAAWVDDTLAAIDELRRIDAQRPLLMFGMVLGANIALQAAVRCAGAPRGLVLWEPVLDGAAYRVALLVNHRLELAREMGLEWPQLVRRRVAAEPSLPGVVLGFAYGPHLIAAIDAIGAGRDAVAGAGRAAVADVAAWTSPALRRGIKVVCGVHDPAAPASAIGTWAQGQADSRLPGLTLQHVQAPSNWMSTEALGTALVPQDLMRSLLGAASTAQAAG